MAKKKIQKKQFMDDEEDFSDMNDMASDD